MKKNAEVMASEFNYAIKYFSFLNPKHDSSLDIYGKRYK